MRTTLSIIFILAFQVFSVVKMSIPFHATDSMTAAQYNSNIDTTAEYLNKIVDTLNLNVPRYSRNSYTHDKIIPYLRADTLRSNTDIDSISGSPYIDTITTDSITARAGVFTGTLTIDSINGSPYIDTIITDSIKARAGTFSGNVNVDSLRSVKGISATTGNFSGNVTANSFYLSGGGIVYQETRACSLIVTGDTVITTLTQTIINGKLINYTLGSLPAPGYVFPTGAVSSVSLQYAAFTFDHDVFYGTIYVHAGPAFNSRCGLLIIDDNGGLVFRCDGEDFTADEIQIDLNSTFYGNFW